MASKHLSSSKERKRSEKGAIENEGRESDDDEEQLRQHLERLAKVTGSKRVSGKDKEKKKQVALLLRQYLEIIENEGSNGDGDEAPAATAGDEEQVGSTVVVDTDGRPSPPMSKSDPKCFADTEKGGFEIGEDDDDDDDDDYEEEEEEDLSASTDEDAAASSDNGSDKLSTEEELLEDVEKEAEDKLSERFLDYDKVWEYAMTTPQGLLGQVKKGFMKPALIEVSNGLLLYARLSFKGGGQLHHDAGVRMTAKEVLAAGPVRARVLFGVQEGWPFNVPLKKGNKKKIYHVAADSQQEAHVWLHTILEAPKDSTKSVRGFLWVESAQTGKWSRYYCIADPTHFEWFRTKEAKTYDMKTLHAKNMKLTGSTVEGSYTETSPVSTMKSTPKVSKKALRSHHMRELKNYDHELILWTRERPVKKVFHFMTESNDRRLFWKNVFVAAAATAKDNADASQLQLQPPSSNTQLASAQHSSIPSPSSSQPGSRGPSRPSSRPSSAYGNGPVSLSDPSYASAAASAPSLSHSEPPSASGGGSVTASSASTGGTVTFSALPAGSNPFQPSAASAYMATRFSSLSEHMAFALKGVGEEEKKTSEKRKEKDASGGAKEDAAGGVVVTPPSSVPATPESRPRLSTLSRDASIFRSGVGLETKETTQLRNDLRDLMEQADREAGKTRFGNYSLAKSGVGDGHVRVISLDGGGLRAVMEAVILERLLEFFPDLLERTDMFAGISGGSMVAAGLVCGRSPTFIRRLLDILAPRVFNPKGRFRTGKAIQSSKFANKNLLVAGSEITKNIKLDQLRPKMLLIPSFLLDNGLNNEERSWEPLIFHNVPLKPKQLRASSLPRSNTRELEVKLQGSGNLTRVHKRSCSIDERKKKDKSASTDPSAPVATSTPSLLGDLKEKEAAHRKKEKKRGESFNNRAFTLRPPSTSSTAASVVSPREKVAHKRTRSSADDLTKVAGIKDRTKESLLRPDSGGLTGSSKLKVRSGVSQKKEEGGESEESDASDDEDDDYDALCVDEERNVPIWDCVMGSSAAPTYFPSYKRQIDAAVMCNNPALAAISTLMSERAAQPKTPKQIHILSLGTGRLSQFIDGDQHDWGMIKWAPYLLQIMIGATSLYEQKQAKAILGPRYHRVDPFLPAPLAMDEPLLLSVLVEQAMKVDLEETIEWIEENWYSEDERKERRAKREREQQQQQQSAAAQTQSSDGAPLANGSSSATAAAGKLQGGASSNSKLKGASSKDKKSRDKKKRKAKKANRKSVYAPVGQEGEESTLRGNWGDAAWFGSLGST